MLKNLVYLNLWAHTISFVFQKKQGFTMEKVGDLDLICE